MSTIPVTKYMTQPLYVAGRYLSSWDQKLEVVGLLRRIENSISQGTKYREFKLANDWGVAYDLLSEESSDSY